MTVVTDVNEQPVKRICVVGGGSAGCLAAVTLRRLLPGRDVVLVQSPSKPVIGVGESTTAYFPVFLHRQLGLDLRRFYDEVEPSWKLGIRFVWGPPEKGHFNYPFSFELSQRVDPLRKSAAFFHLQHPGYPGPVSALMDQDRSPCLVDQDGRRHMIDRPFGYHIDNKKFLAFLHIVATELGVRFIDGDVVDVTQDESGDVGILLLESGESVHADLFIDCSGFESLLLGKTMNEKFVSYADALLCDKAIVGSFDRDDLIHPYTTAETMNHGWCWSIDLPDRVTLGYVHSSSFCSPDEAIRELREKKPHIDEDLCVINFPSGRYENCWRGNVIGIGNASGFVEPLESTALHMIAEQLIDVVRTLIDSDYRIQPAATEIVNVRFRNSWDAVRDFLAVHYKFNGRLQTPFWRYCREKIDLGEAAPLVEAYQRLGPHQVCEKYVATSTLVQYEGFLALLIGQSVETENVSLFGEQDLREWAQYQQMIAQQTAGALSVREALDVVRSAQWRWS